MRLYTTLILLIVCISLAKAQQEAHYTQFMQNNTLLNPGFVGARRTPSVMALYRNQWTGFKGNPRSYMIGIDAPIPKHTRLGAGLMISKQTEGIISRNNTNLSFSYSILQTENSTLRVGISSTLRQYRFDLLSSEAYIQDRQDASLGQSDQTNFSKINFGTGVYYDFKTFYIGLSVPNLIKNSIYLSANSKAKTQGFEHQHVYFSAGGLFPIGNGDIEFKPAILYKYVSNAPFSLDANASFLFKKRFMTGLSYRYGGSGGTGDSVDLLAYVQANEALAFGIAYDYPLSQLGRNTKGSIEFLMRYDITNNTKILHNPRFFF